MAIQRFKLVSGPTHIQNVPEAASQTFLAGDLVFMSSDAVTICTGTAQGGSGIFGVAAANATSTTGAKVAVYVVSPEQVWRAFPATTVVPTASFDVGVDYKLPQASAGAAVVGGAGADAVVASFDYNGNDGTSAGDPILIRFDADACQARLG
jgi:hypothetical protein